MKNKTLFSIAILLIGNIILTNSINAQNSGVTIDLTEKCTSLVEGKYVILGEKVGNETWDFTIQVKKAAIYRVTARNSSTGKRIRLQQSTKCIGPSRCHSFTPLKCFVVPGSGGECHCFCGAWEHANI